MGNLFSNTETPIMPPSMDSTNSLVQQVQQLKEFLREIPNHPTIQQTQQLSSYLESISTTDQIFEEVDREVFEDPELISLVIIALNNDTLSNKCPQLSFLILFLSSFENNRQPLTNNHFFPSLRNFMVIHQQNPDVQHEACG